MPPPTLVNSTSSTNKTLLTPEHRARLCQVLNQLDDDQLRLIVTNHLQNATIPHKFQHYSRLQLFQQCLILIDNYYTAELEQFLYALRQKRFPTDFYPQQQQQQQQQQQPNSLSSFNPQQSYQFNQPNYHLTTSSPAIAQQLRPIRPNANSSQTSTPRLQPPPPSSQQQQQQPSSYMSLLAQQQQLQSNRSSLTPVFQRYQVPILAPPPQSTPPTSSSSSSSSSSTSQPPFILPSTNNSTRSPINKIAHKPLPFYRSITCVYERYYIFHYDQYRKQYSSHDEFLLSFDVCNQLALSYDYDPNLNIHKTSKCLILRLARIDQPPTFEGKYDDNLPPNLSIHINGHIVTNLPIPKACTRQQNDLIRIGREIDITPHCMFNPTLKNEIKISWSYRQDNTSLHFQYANAQYALHIFLVDHLTIEELCEQIKKKPVKFFRDDLVKLLAKARANEGDLELEVSDQKLKLVCPIDQRRLKKPIRATTCQHLQCFDLTNYIALNEKSNKWICPVCNKFAFFDDLQIDAYTESILTSIQNENITEITINSDLQWKPVIPPKNLNESISHTNPNSSSTDFILLDDDD